MIRYEQRVNQDDQYLQQYSDSIIQKLGPNLVQFMKNSLLKQEKEQFQLQKEALIKQFQKTKTAEQAEVQNNVTKVIETCNSEYKFEKKIFEKMIQKYQRFADNITSFAWCQVCQGPQIQQINEDNQNELPVENVQNIICQAQCTQKYMQVCKLIGIQYNQDDQEIAKMQNEFQMQKQINQDKICNSGHKRTQSEWIQLKDFNK